MQEGSKLKRIKNEMKYKTRGLFYAMKWEIA